MFAPLFTDRADAGGQLAELLLSYAERTDVVVLALPRGGVPVAYEVAKRLKAPLDILVVRKLGLPGYKELAIGAVTSRGQPILNKDIIEMYQVSSSMIAQLIEEEQAEVERRERIYRGERPPIKVTDQTVLLIDDGLATGATMRAALGVLEQLGPKKIVIAVPIASAQTCEELRREGYETICAACPEPFFAVGQGYLNFEQTTDQEVLKLLKC